MDTVVAAFEKVATAAPRKPAIFWGREVIRYGQLQQRIVVCAALLQICWRVQRGDRVGILLKNSPEFIYTLYAALGSGAGSVQLLSHIQFEFLI